jgi:hypothetical protein
MKNRLRFDLGYLASIEYQRQFIVGGTKARGLTPSVPWREGSDPVPALYATPHTYDMPPS